MATKKKTSAKKKSPRRPAKAAKRPAKKAKITVKAKAAPKAVKAPAKKVAASKAPRKAPKKKAGGSDAKALHQKAAKLFASIRGDEKHADKVLREVAVAFEKAAKAGEPAAWIDFGRCLWNGWGVKQNRVAAMRAYREAANLGSSFGAHITAYNLYWEFGKWDEAYVYAKAALKGGDPRGAVHHLLGLMAFHGRGRKADPVEAFTLQTVAAKRGDPDAMFELYAMLSTGQGTRANEVDGLKWLIKAAERGQPRACYSLGAHYAMGRGVKQDDEAAFAWYESASSRGYGRASATLGVMALSGSGMKKSQSRATEYFERAKAQGFDVDEFLESIGVG